MPRCPRCGSPHDSLDGVATHIWKKDDADHDADSKDEGMRIAVEEEYSESPEDDGTNNSSSDSTDPTLDDGPPDVQDEPDEEIEAPCGCVIPEDGLEDGKVYECSEHGKRFRYTA